MQGQPPPPARSQLGQASRLWAFLRELSGEAALERRMRACACADDPVKAAWSEAFDGIHRCC